MQRPFWRHSKHEISLGCNFSAAPCVIICAERKRFYRDVSHQNDRAPLFNQSDARKLERAHSTPLCILHEREYICARHYFTRTHSHVKSHGTKSFPTSAPGHKRYTQKTQKSGWKFIPASRESFVTIKGMFGFSNICLKII